MSDNTQPRLKIYCTCCNKDVPAELVNGRKIYPHREDLKQLLFWQCDTCNNYVGCHKNPRRALEPLGVISTPEIRNARRHIHELLDPIWQNGQMSRSDLYREIGSRLGYVFHTANIKSLEEGRKVWKIIKEIQKELHVNNKKITDG